MTVDVSMVCSRCTGNLVSAPTKPPASPNGHTQAEWALEMASLRATAQAQGWTITPAEDICPDCTPLMEASA